MYNILEILFFKAFYKFTLDKFIIVKKILFYIFKKGIYLMKYIKKIPSIDRDLSDVLISRGWKKIKEPSNLKLAILFSIPFMFINSIIVNNGFETYYK